MSGFIGIFDRDGDPVDRELLAGMTGALSFRGPDAQQVWLDGAVGLGHALLCTTPESARERQPCTLDGQVWIAADARVDARGELISKLEAAGRREVRRAADPELILHAYQVWGEECLQHLIGDFAFLVWDGRRRVLFGARDHFGVKPFYYAEAGRSLLCSNTPSCLRLDPRVSGELNDLAIADFLLFNGNQDPATTYFAGIQRLPGGHCLVCSEAGLQVKRYWTLPYREIRYKRAHDYVDHFHEVFRQAIEDRIRTGRVTVFMSGGADSTLIAAVAHQILGKSADLRAQTVVFDRIIPDREREYARMAAEFISIPIEFLPADDYAPFDRNLGWQFSKIEPEPYPLAGLYFDRYRQAAEYSKVVLTGFGGDPAMHTNDGYIADYLKPRAWGELIAGIAWCFRLSGRVPRLGIRTLLREKFGTPAAPFRFPYPAWLNRDFEKRLDLTGRWERINNPPASSSHPRSTAHDILFASVWQDLFESLDPGASHFHIEQRHPFFDPRLAAFLTGLPALPWRQEKNIMKAASRGILPESVRLRPKASLAGDPIWAHLRDCGPEWWARHLNPVPELTRYADPDRLPRATAGNRHALWVDLRPVSLNYWLQFGRKSPLKIQSPLKDLH